METDLPSPKNETNRIFFGTQELPFLQKSLVPTPLPPIVSSFQSRPGIAPATFLGADLIEHFACKHVILRKQRYYKY